MKGKPSKAKQACADARDIISSWIDEGRIPLDAQAARLLAQLKEGAR